MTIANFFIPSLSTYLYHKKISYFTSTHKQNTAPSQHNQTHLFFSKHYIQKRFSYPFFCSLESINDILYPPDRDIKSAKIIKENLSRAILLWLFSFSFSLLTSMNNRPECDAFPPTVIIILLFSLLLELPPLVPHLQCLSYRFLHDFLHTLQWSWPKLYHNVKRHFSPLINAEHLKSWPANSTTTKHSSSSFLESVSII